MFWMKKLAVGAMLAVFLAGGLFAGLRDALGWRCFARSDLW